jgi:predicted enzyme related to lactoylglutathione lyase
MAKALGFGGVFLKAQDPKALSTWYSVHLGIAAGEDGSLAFDGPSSMGMTVFAHFPVTTAYFGDGPQSSMVNFRVDNLDELLKQLAEAGVRIDPNREDFTYGRFAWIWDSEGNRVELWEPLSAE